MKHALTLAVLVSLLPTPLFAQAPARPTTRPPPTTAPPTPPAGPPPAPPPPPPAGQRRPPRPIVLNPDDKPAFPDPPAGFNTKRDGIPHGKLEMVEYDSKTVGTTRKMLVYTPPDYDAAKKYPVLYLLHGIGGDENEWRKF